ncbi:hypothetical protein ACFOET_02590 [Parapedobacter deserti]|uniref:Transposase n=1 Tax=Parapedobacter deserti TaxID=1912957 RepID=A0ABV7JI12_9SPHI
MMKRIYSESSILTKFFIIYRCGCSGLEETPRKPTERPRKYERDTEHLVEQMIADFAKDHNLILESGRLYELLAKYVDKELEKRETTKKTKGGKVSKKKVFAYVRKK